MKTVRASWIGGIGVGVGGALGLALYLGLPDVLQVDLDGRTYRLAQPRQLAWLGVMPIVLWVTVGTSAEVGALRRIGACLVRGGLVAWLVAVLAEPAVSVRAADISLVFAVDVSDSTQDADVEKALRQVREAWHKRGPHDVQLVAFARHPEPIPLSDERLAGLDAAAMRELVGDTQETDVAASVRLAHGLFREGHLRRLAIHTDGIETRGQLAVEAAAARRSGTRLYFNAMRSRPPPELAVTHLDVPRTLRVGEPFEVHATLFATEPAAARLTLYQDAVANGLDAVREITLPAGESRFSFESVVRRSGSVAYRLELEPKGMDRFAGNNRYEVTAHAPGKPTVLIVDGSPTHTERIAQALDGNGFDVEVRGSRALPRSDAELARYDFLVLSDVPADKVTPSQMQLIERYVRDGGGFLMAGGEQAFGLGGYADSPLEKLLPVRMDAQHKQEERTLALALVIDTSGSMTGQKMEMAKEAARATAALLGPRDALAVVGFASSPQRIVRMQSARNEASIARDISRLVARGGTSILPALEVAYQDLAITPAKAKHVILLTDGQTRERGIVELVKSMRGEAITVSVVGLGEDVHRQLLEDVARVGGGRAHFTSDPQHVPRLFLRETSTVSRNSAVEEYVRARPVHSADFLRGIDLSSAPYLRGYVATQAKPAPAQVILETDLGEPLLARGRVGLGWALAWTSDIKTRWSVDWVRWAGFAPFWSQLVREHMRRDHRERLPLEAEVVGDELRVSVDAVDRDDRFLNDLESTLQIQATEDGTVHEERLVSVAPGRYEARWRWDRYGAFLLSAQHRREGRVVAESFGHVANPYPREWRELRAAENPLWGSGGSSDTGSATGVDHLLASDGEWTRRELAFWPYCLLLSIGLFVIDVALRRVTSRHRRGVRVSSTAVAVRDVR